MIANSAPDAIEDYVTRRALEISPTRALSNTAASDFIEGKKCFM